jgi:hypothetical protein
MKPRDSQLQLAELGYNVLCKHMICYLAMEERTGKTLTAILIAEKCQEPQSILVVTKKNALKGWKDTLKAYLHTEKKYTVTNYHQVHKMGRHDLIILDESHNYIAGYPKQPAINANL